MNKQQMPNQQQYQQPYQQQPPKKKSRKGLWITLGIISGIATIAIIAPLIEPTGSGITIGENGSYYSAASDDGEKSSVEQLIASGVPEELAQQLADAFVELDFKPSNMFSFKQSDDWADGKRYTFTYNLFGKYTLYERSGVVLSIKDSAEKDIYISKVYAEELSSKAESESEARTELVKNSISLSKLYTGTPNTADGVDLHIVYTNISDKTIKYITFTVEAYNAVNDPVTDDITGESIKSVKQTGPVEPGSVQDITSECLWYNSTVKTAKLGAVKIEYMDGTIIYIDTTDELSLIIASNKD